MPHDKFLRDLELRRNPYLGLKLYNDVIGVYYMNITTDGEFQRGPGLSRSANVVRAWRSVDSVHLIQEVHYDASK